MTSRTPRKNFSASNDLHITQAGQYGQFPQLKTTVPVGDTPGSWKDGGSFHSYHGSETLATEWDEFDFSVQPFEYTPYGATGKDEPDTMRTGLSYKEKINGVEYLARVTTTAPSGEVFEGAGHVELFINGSFAPYGFV